ncbi:MAG: hypothetical protein IKK26_03670, partial [Clostridia bacterium]|nr:hypothetical protein [Clostridia bacterium]
QGNIHTTKILPIGGGIAVYGEYFLTTVYPTDTAGVHGNSGGKSAGKDVFASGKRRKCLETSGNRYSQILWEQDAAGSSPVTSTKNPNSTFCRVWIFLFINVFSHSPVGILLI